MLRDMAASLMKVYGLVLRLVSALEVVALSEARLDMEAFLSTFRKKNILQSARN